MISLPITSRYQCGCSGFTEAANVEGEKGHSKLEIFPVVASFTLAIIAFLLLTKKNANIPGVIVAISLCGIIVYYNWKAYRKDGQRPYDPVKLPFRKGEFKSDREPEETFDWDSLNRYRDNLGAPWALEYFGNPNNEEWHRMTPEFREFLVVCRRQSALFLILNQIAEEKGIRPLDVAKMFDEDQQRFLMDRAGEARKIMDQIMGENSRTMDGVWFHDIIPLGGKVTWPKFSDRFQDLRTKYIDFEKEIVDYVRQINGN